VSIIIPAFNNIELTQKCLRSLIAATHSRSVEIVVVDNGSQPQCREALAALASGFDWIRTVSIPSNVNFALGCNIGASYATGEYIVFLNNDTEVTRDWLEPLIAPLAADEHLLGTQP